MNESDIREAVEVLAKNNLPIVEPTKEDNAIHVLLDLAQSVLDAKMPEKKELKFNSSIEEKIRIAENSIINTFRLYQAKKMLGLEELISKNITTDIEYNFDEAVKKITTAIRKHMEE